MKKSKIIVPALGILVLSTAASITGTVAWFSSNASAKVEGMQVTTKVSSNLLISGENVEANYGAQLRQGRTGILEPASTVNGESFFWTAGSNVTATGDAKAESYTAYAEDTNLTNAGADKTQYDNEFNENYVGEGVSITTSNVTYAYIDYTFFLKATATGGDKEIRMTVCNLSYAGAAMSGGEKAWRVGLFAQSAAKEGEANANPSGIGSKKMLLAQSGAVHFTSGKAVSSTSALDTVTYGGAGGAVVGSVTDGQTAYYKVVVRLWLEGEDNTCNNDTYAALTSAYKLNLAFSVDGTTAAVTTLGEAAHTDEIPNE